MQYKSTISFTTIWNFYFNKSLNFKDFFDIKIKVRLKKKIIKKKKWFQEQKFTKEILYSVFIEINIQWVRCCEYLLKIDCKMQNRFSIPSHKPEIIFKVYTRSLEHLITSLCIRQCKYCKYVVVLFQHHYNILKLLSFREWWRRWIDKYGFNFCINILVSYEK